MVRGEQKSFVNQSLCSCYILIMVFEGMMTFFVVVCYFSMNKFLYTFVSLRTFNLYIQKQCFTNSVKYLIGLREKFKLICCYSGERLTCLFVLFSLFVSLI